MGLRIDLMYGLEAAVMRCGSKLGNMLGFAAADLSLLS
jgi:hypothetical protein